MPVGIYGAITITNYCAHKDSERKDADMVKWKGGDICKGRLITILNIDFVESEKAG